MLYTEDTRIEALAVHVVGNKSKDEPLTVSPQLSAQVADEGLMRTLTAYFLGGFKSEECYNLHHETDLGCNEVWNFACRIFDDPEALLEHSVSLAKHLYESGMHPQIKGGEFYTPPACCSTSRNVSRVSDLNSPSASQRSPPKLQSEK